MFNERLRARVRREICKYCELRSLQIDLTWLLKILFKISQSRDTFLMRKKTFVILSGL